MNKRQNIAPLIFCILFLLLNCKTEKKDQEELQIENSKPNIVLIVADDMGWYDLGCYGNEFIETPNLDSLAAQGMRFTDGYAAAPLCSPSRASLLTGLHPITVNVTEHIHGNHPPGPNQKLKTPSVDQQLDLEYTTTAEALKEQGYTTAHIGKWHLGGGKFSPQYQGFDLNIAGAWNGLPKSFFYPFFPMGEKPEIQEGYGEGDYLTDVLTDKAVSYIEEKKDTVFFLNLNFYSPHVPIEGKAKLVEKYRRKRGNDEENIMPNIHYAAMIESIDQNVGRVMQTLEELNLAENTLIIFTSDNGGLSVEEVPAFARHTPPTDNGRLREGKGYLYEGGIREPFIVRWPAMIGPEQENSTPVIGQDLFNTFMELSGSHQRTEDGKSLLPIFKGEKLEERPLVWHLPHYSPQREQPVSAYRDGHWKLLHFYEDDSYELYNLAMDLGETEDLADTRPEKLELMKTEMNALLEKMGAKFPEPNPNYTGN
ncbi:sulfatase [Poritiphilus flavus]|uniref:Sulfatase-like hydrolase/transferase n=1 Tax=Poritiphilus flavus TaxID=2697053 RepID=A0A6L9E782_9FLAO|nr:sulfatase [Poritiphilus flavus]NAS10540.1 sulfatase-like hydrolase/transferase [Poritiphilus flavus]